MAMAVVSVRSFSWWSLSLLLLLHWTDAVAVAVAAAGEWVAAWRPICCGGRFLAVWAVVAAAVSAVEVASEVEVASAAAVEASVGLVEVASAVAVPRSEEQNV